MLYMIDLLNTGNIYSLKELSQKIGVSERMIRYYKNEIYNNGIIIESFKGPNGGYFMIDKIKNYTRSGSEDACTYETLRNRIHDNALFGHDLPLLAQHPHRFAGKRV